MSRPKNSQKLSSGHVEGPVKRGSVLYRVLEAIARRTAERLAEDPAATKRQERQQGAQRSR